MPKNIDIDQLTINVHYFVDFVVEDSIDFDRFRLVFGCFDCFAFLESIHEVSLKPQ